MLSSYDVAGADWAISVEVETFSMQCQVQGVNHLLRQQTTVAIAAYLPNWSSLLYFTIAETHKPEIKNTR